MDSGKPVDFGFDAVRLDRISGWMDGYVAARKFAGLGLLIARDGHVVYSNTAGLRDIKAGLPFERDTIARIYSMTKPVVSTALMLLVERGLIHLEAPVSDFIPAFASPVCLIKNATDISQTEPCVAPTLHQLLVHTSGLSYPFNPGVLPKAIEQSDFSFQPDKSDLATMINRLAEFPLAFQPGSKWEYSLGIDVIGRVVEVVSGMSLADFLQTEIFTPLGMTETDFSVPKQSLGRFASLYTPLAGDALALNSANKGSDSLRLVDEAASSPWRNCTMYSGGGGLVGTMDDYLRFTEMLRCGGCLNEVRLLSPKTVSFMMRNHLPGDIASMGPASFAEQPMEGMGFGLGGAVLLDPALVKVPGSVGDFSWGGIASTFFWIDPEHDLSVVFFTQLSPSSSYPARPQLKALVHGALI